MAGHNRSRLKTYLYPVEVKEAVVTPPAPPDDLPKFTAPPPNVKDDEERDEDAAILQLNRVQAGATSTPVSEDHHHLFEKLVERLEALADRPPAPPTSLPEPVLNPLLFERLVERLEALSDRPMTESEQYIEHLYGLHQSVVATLTTLSESLREKPVDTSHALLEHMTVGLANQQAEIASLAETQRDIIQSLNESQVVIAQVVISLVEKVNALSLRQPMINVPAPIVNVQVKEGGVITKTIERDERGLISKVTEAPAR